MHGIPIAEYSATQVKKTTVGHGHASKDQVEWTLRSMMNKYLPTEKVKADAMDAMAIALCHDRLRKK